jgi:hypothetical protein
MHGITTHGITKHGITKHGITKRGTAKCQPYRVGNRGLRAPSCDTANTAPQPIVTKLESRAGSELDHAWDVPRIIERLAAKISAWSER